MIGTWHFLLQTPESTIKLQFIIEKMEAYALSVIAEPFPFPIEIHTVTVDGDMLQAKGSSRYVADEPIEFDLTFEDDEFHGRVKLPYQEAFFVQGAKGPGPSLQDMLITELQPYRKHEVRQRNEEEIRQAVEILLAKMSVADKIGTK